MREKQERKATRLPEYDYSGAGAYFVTICTKNRRCILSKIVGAGVLDSPKVVLTKYGNIAEKQIQVMDELYENLSVDKYVIMPNHIHLLVRILCVADVRGSSGTPTPTYNSHISRFVSTFKRYCNKQCNDQIWQRGFYDHVVRNDDDYDVIWQYIDDNTIKWELDKFYKTR